MEKPISRTSEQNDQCGIVSLIFSEKVKGGRVMNYLKYNDPKHQEPYQIPLGYTGTYKKSEHPKHHNIVVPFMPMRYTTVDNDKTKADTLREGWLYVFRQGEGEWELWRELGIEIVIGIARLQDVNLTRFAGKDERHATIAERDWRLIVPYKIDGKEQTIRIAYSEVQWSWAYIQRMLGDETARNRRTQQIDLCGYGKNWPETGGEGDKALVANIKDLPAHIEIYEPDKDSNIPVVYLHDPIGVAVALEEAIEDQINNLMGWVDAVNELKTTGDSKLMKLPDKEKESYLHSALIAYHTFLNPDNQTRTREIALTSVVSVDVKRKTDIGKALADLDVEFLEKLLAVEDRKTCRKKIRERQEELARFLSGDYNKGGASLDINEAIRDYAFLSGPVYLQLWERMKNLTHHFGYDPSTFDADFDLTATVNAERKGRLDDAGSRYLDSLLNPRHPLHSALFPPPGEPNDSEGIAGPPESPNARGDFRPLAFAGAVQFGIVMNKFQVLRNSFSYSEYLLTDFIAGFSKQYQGALAGKNVESIEALVRLGRSTGLPEFEGMRIEAPGRPGRIIIGADKIETVGTLMRNEARADARAMVKANEAGGGQRVDIVDAKGTIRASEDITRLNRPSGTPNADFRAAARTGNEEVIRRIRGKVVTVPETNRWALAFYKPEMAQTSAVKTGTKVMHGASKVLPPLVALFEVWNLQRTVHDLQQDKAFKGAISVGSAAYGVMFASVDALLKVVGHKEVMTNLSNLGRTGKILQRGINAKIPIAGRNIALFSGTPGGASAGAAMMYGFGAVMSTLESIERYRLSDYDAAAAYGVAATSFSMAALTALGGRGGFKALSRLGPYGKYFLLVGIAGYGVGALVTDSDLENWAKHGPFSKKTANRMSKMFEGKTYADAEVSLMDKFMRPRVSIRREGEEPFLKTIFNQKIIWKDVFSFVPTDKPAPDILVEVIAPGYVPEQSELTVETTRGETFSRSGSALDALNPTNLIMNDVLDTFSWAYNLVMEPKFPICFETEPILTETGAQMGVRYRYRGMPGEWHTRVRYKTEFGFSLPYGKSAIEPGWVTASKTVKK